LSSKIMAHGSGGLTSKVWVQSQKDVYNSVCFKSSQIIERKIVIF